MADQPAVDQHAEEENGGVDVEPSLLERRFPDHPDHRRRAAAGRRDLLPVPEARRGRGRPGQARGWQSGLDRGRGWLLRAVLPLLRGPVSGRNRRADAPPRVERVVPDHDGGTGGDPGAAGSAPAARRSGSRRCARRGPSRRRARVLLAASASRWISSSVPSISSSSAAAIAYRASRPRWTPPSSSPPNSSRPGLAGDQLRRGDVDRTAGAGAEHSVELPAAT